MRIESDGRSSSVRASSIRRCRACISGLSSEKYAPAGGRRCKSPDANASVADLKHDLEDDRERCSRSDVRRATAPSVALPDVIAFELSEHLRNFPPGDDGLVFTQADGRPNIWKPALEASASRPTDATGCTPAPLLRLAPHRPGESVVAVAEYLGHADPGFTLRVYAHLFPCSEDRARRAIDSAFGPQGIDRPASRWRPTAASAGLVALR